MMFFESHFFCKFLIFFFCKLINLLIWKFKLQNYTYRVASYKNFWEMMSEITICKNNFAQQVKKNKIVFVFFSRCKIKKKQVYWPLCNWSFYNKHLHLLPCEIWGFWPVCVFIVFPFVFFYGLIYFQVFLLLFKPIHLSLSCSL